MKQKSLAVDYFRCVILSVLGTVGVSCYILADTFFVSKGLGINGLTALNLAIPVYNFIHGTGMMLGMGGATRFSVCRSQSKFEELPVIYTNMVYLAALFSAVFLLAGFAFAGPLAALLGADETVMGMTSVYLRWLLLFSPGFLMNDILLCFMRNDGRPQAAMTAMLIGSFSNIALDYVFIFPMGMGIFGAVLATGLSPLISISTMLPQLARRRSTFYLIKTRLNTDIGMRGLALGLPALIDQISPGIVMILLNILILKAAGNVGVAAYGIVANIALVILALYTGIAQGVQPLISSLYGRDEKQTKRLLKYAMLTILAVSCLLYLFLYRFAQPITGVFNSQRSAELEQIAVQGIQLYFLSLLFAGFNTILTTYFAAIERVLPAQAISVIRGLILIIPLAVILASLGGITGIWLAYPVTEGIAAILGAVIYLRGRKRI